MGLKAAKGQSADDQRKHGGHPTQVNRWKRQLPENDADVFNEDGYKEHKHKEAAQTELYEQVGRLKMELE